MPKKKGTNRNRKNQEENKSKVQKEHKNLASLKRQGVNLSEIGDGSLTVDRPLTTRTQRSAPARQTRTDDRPTSRRDVSQMGKVPRKTRPIQDDVDARLDEDQIAADLAAEQEDFDSQNEDFDADLNAYLFTNQAQAEQQAEIERQAEEARKAKEEAEQKAEEARKAKEEKDRQDEEARKAKEEAERKAEEARKAKEEKDRQDEEARKAKEEAEQKAEEARKAKEKAEQKAEEARKAKEAAEQKAEAERQAQEQLAKNDLRQRISSHATASADWLLLTVPQRDAIVDAAYQAAFLSDQQRKQILLNARPKKGTATEKDAAAQTKLAQTIQSRTTNAINKAMDEVKRVAKPARDAQRQAKLVQDQNLLRNYINGLPGPQNNANVKAILLRAIDQFSFSNHAYGTAISKAYPADDIKQAALQWNDMQTRVNSPIHPIQVVANMHVPGGAQTDLKWKDRGKNWERTKNLVAEVDGVKNNIHLYTTGGWQVSKSQPKPKDYSD
ncbi:hypothetical protein [Alkalinema sp. FACHB-956]|uniref:hypothetical protein n=1 Tax=Alkalinema sp. FACHB-956 TaxID=2692768 RepID=UPI0016873D4D|nr:hypothetical protein [Alkalinema sp. FACHB-956]MBD2328065.1 hypothetical protein [Alkalinema sp. FACHB-956]